MDKHPMTPESFEQLREELKTLKTRERQKIVLEIERARGHGDISENAEYEAAKEKQGLLEAKIRDLETRLGAAEVIETSGRDAGRVVFGATVVLEDLDSGEQLRLRIVGPEEADLRQGKISVHSPMARAMIGKEVDDEVVVRAPGGTRSYAIQEILFV
jgi:transcription elongation factor GreA